MLIRVLFALVFLICSIGGWGWYSDRQALESLQDDLSTTQDARDRYRAAFENNEQQLLRTQERLQTVVSARDAAEQRATEIEARYVDATNTLAELRSSSPVVADWSDQPVPDDVADWLRGIRTGSPGDH